MELTEPPIVIDDRFVQYAKAKLRIVVTDDGISNDTNVVQPLNASSPMMVTVFGRATWPRMSGGIRQLPWTSWTIMTMYTTVMPTKVSDMRSSVHALSRNFIVFCISRFN